MTELTKKESEFIKHFLDDNGCGARTPNELTADNFSCQNIEDLCEYQELSSQQVGAFIGSLIEKDIIHKEERNKNETDLFWINDSFLENLQKDEQGHTAFQNLKLSKDDKKRKR